jgi:hypothetical protein
MPTLEELLRYKYGDSQTPEDVLAELENIYLEQKKNAKAIPISPPIDRIVPVKEDDSPYGKVESGLYNALQKYGPSTFDSPYQAHQTARALTDVISMTPGAAEILDYKQGNYLMEQGETLPALGYHTMAALPLIPANRIRRAIPDDMGGGGTISPNVGPSDYQVDMKLGPRQGGYAPKVISLAEEAVVKAPGFEFNKAYPIEEMINRMSKYHNPTKNKGPANPKIKRQFENFVSEEFLARGKASPAELQAEIQKNKMRFKESHTQFEVEPSTYPSWKQETLPADPEIKGFSEDFPFRDAEGRNQMYMMKTGENYPLSAETPSKYGELNLRAFGSKYGDEPLFNDEYSPMHTRVGQGPQANFEQDVGSLGNRIVHGRYRIVEKDGKSVGELSEAQSDRFRFTGTGKQDLGFLQEGSAYRGLTSGQIAEQTSGIRSFFQDVTPSFIKTVEAMSDFGNANPNMILNGFSRSVGEAISKKLSAIPPERLNISGNKTFVSPEDMFDAKSVKALFKEVINDPDFTTDLQYLVDASKANGMDVSDSIRLRNTFGDTTKRPSVEAYKKGMLDALDRADPKVMNYVMNHLSTWVKPLGDDVSQMVLPLAEKNEWYDLTLKRFIQEMHGEGVDVIHIPINGKANYRQMGRNKVSIEASDLGKIYQKQTDRVLKNIQKEYGFKITPKIVDDEFGQMFYEIALDENTAKIGEVLKYNRGGLATLMPLKYN